MVHLVRNCVSICNYSAYSAPTQLLKMPTISPSSNTKCLSCSTRNRLPPPVTSYSKNLRIRDNRSAYSLNERLQCLTKCNRNSCNGMFVRTALHARKHCFVHCCINGASRKIIAPRRTTQVLCVVMVTTSAYERRAICASRN